MSAILQHRGGRFAYRCVMKKAAAKKATKKATPTKASAKKAAPKKSASTKAAPTKAAGTANLRNAALEATGLAEQVLQGRNISADVGLETKGNAFYAVVRVRVEDLPALLG